MKIVNGTIIDPVNNMMYAQDLEFGNDSQVIDAAGCLIAPGMIDTHSHFRDPGFTHKEDILTGSMAAKAGGYTQIVLMANTNPKVDNLETLAYVLNKGSVENTGIKINTCANVTMNMEGRMLTNMRLLAENGAVGFTDDGVPLLDSDVCLSAMRECTLLSLPISFHEENPKFIENNGVNAGAASAYFNIKGSPREAETDLIKRDIELMIQCRDQMRLNGEIPANHPGPCVVIQHISTKEGVELVRRAKADGLDIHAEATPHHFSLTEEAVIEKGTLAKMNPPLRTEEDRMAIIEGLKDGTIDIIATDHAPHSTEEKSKPLTQAPSGIIGLETALSLAIRELVQPGFLTYPQLFNRISTSPAHLYGLKGGTVNMLNPDLVVFNPSESRKVEKFFSKSSNSPFTGEILPGVIKYTICNGKVVYQNI